jgi:hypothetical protein
MEKNKMDKTNVLILVNLCALIIVSLFTVYVTTYSDTKIIEFGDSQIIDNKIYICDSDKNVYNVNNDLIFVVKQLKHGDKIIITIEFYGWIKDIIKIDNELIGDY